jgi:hypothetical protein
MVEKPLFDILNIWSIRILKYFLSSYFLICCLEDEGLSLVLLNELLKLYKHIENRSISALQIIFIVFLSICTT